MKNIFIVPGYGIPKNILTDEPYRHYLSWVFNFVFQISLKKKDKHPIVIFCGGKTDTFPPYQRTESIEIKKLFTFWADRDFVKNKTKDWQYKLDKKSISTVENILEAEKIISKISGNKQIYVFVEFTRASKMKKLVQVILKTNFKIIPLDFDLSANRYRDSNFIKEKEKIDLRYSLRAIEDINFLKKFRQIMLEKLAFLRQQSTSKHQESIHVWWQKKLQELNSLK